MSSMTLVLGGTRSGKSALAERLAAAAAAAAAPSTASPAGAVTYVATATVYDVDMAERVGTHQARRPATWETVELDGGDLPALIATLQGTVLLDSLGTWVASAPDMQVDCDGLVRALASRAGATVVVSEEVGLAVHPPTPAGRAFVDALGSLNQAVAAAADRVLLVVAGRALELGRAPELGRRLEM